MESMIVSGGIDTMLFNTLRDFMKKCIKDSLNELDICDTDEILWFKDCGLNDYFVDWDEIWNGNEFVGVGLDAISHRFILNAETFNDFNKAFIQARDEAYKEFTDNL